jgi:hypothetical protein
MPTSSGTEASGTKSIPLREIPASNMSRGPRRGCQDPCSPHLLQDGPSLGAGLRAPPASAATAPRLLLLLLCWPPTCGTAPHGPARVATGEEKVGVGELGELQGPASLPSPPPTPIGGGVGTHAHPRPAEAAAGEAGLEGGGGRAWWAGPWTSTMLHGLCGAYGGWLESGVKQVRDKRGLTAPGNPRDSSQHVHPSF